MSSHPPYIQMIRAEATGDLAHIHETQTRLNAEGYVDPIEIRYVFTLCTGNRWMELGAREPDPKMLFGEFWQQGELCILFADTNAGKSVLAVQLADSLTRRKAIGPFPVDSPKASVLYVDFELGTKQFHVRYSDAKGDYDFAENFFRAQLNPANAMPLDPKTYDRYILAALSERITQVKATVLIIDNLSCMRNGTDNGRNALALMKDLKDLKKEFNLSVLVLAHTPKRNPALPVTANDLQGSKLLINFADSAFAIGKSTTQPGIHYLKQIKQRSTGEKYGAENVCLCRIVKPKNFLQFQFSGNGRECEHLLSPARQNREQLAQQIAGLTQQGKSQRNISRELNIPLTTVNRLIQAATQNTPLQTGNLAPDSHREPN